MVSNPTKGLANRSYACPPWLETTEVIEIVKVVEKVEALEIVEVIETVERILPRTRILTLGLSMTPIGSAICHALSALQLYLR
jgi:hypothetical protein